MLWRRSSPERGMWRPASALGVLRVPGGDDHDGDDDHECNALPMTALISRETMLYNDDIIQENLFLPVHISVAMRHKHHRLKWKMLDDDNYGDGDNDTRVQPNKWAGGALVAAKLFASYEVASLHWFFIGLERVATCNA